MGIWTTIPKKIYIDSEETKDKVTLFLEQEMKQDALNYQMMLHVVDMTTLTKAKITALSKLGNQYKKNSLSLIKKYKQLKPNTTLGKEYKWIIK